MDSQFNSPRCNQNLSVAANGAGMLVNCPNCKEQIEIPRGIAPSGAMRKEIGVKEYKVLTQKDRFFGGKFDPEKLEKAINSYAAEGWSVVSVATASIPSLTGNREENFSAAFSMGPRTQQFLTSACRYSSWPYSTPGFSLSWAERKLGG
jgi:Domain of unknown function (DUF4177)